MATSNVVLFDQNQRPSYALQKAEPSSLTKALAGGGAFGKRISIKGGVFRLISDGKEVAAIDERYLDVVIIRSAEKIGRTYYSQKFDEEHAAAPDCWSPDGVKPDASVAAPQYSSCAQCPQNAKGSGNEETRACRFSQRVAVLLANDMEGEVMQLVLPAKSLFGKEEGDNRPLQAYARYVAAGNANIEWLITRLKFDTSVATPKLFFKAMRWLTDEELEIVKEKAASEDAIRACVMTVAQMDKVEGAAPPAAVTQALGKPPAAAEAPAPAAPAPKAPAAEEEPPPPPPSTGRKPRGKAAAKTEAPPKPPVEDAEPPAPEPTVRKTAAPATQLPERKSIANIAASWDTDD